MQINKTHITALLYLILASLALSGLIWRINSDYSETSPVFISKRILLTQVQTASPAIITAGRNIAFETGNGVSNAPASYLTMLDCCESDEAIAARIAVGQLKCNIIKRKRHD